jgi:hypothetical protein
MEISDKNNSVTLEEYQLTKNKNIFEEVIDKMMLESFTPEFSDKIMNMPLKDKRMSILSLLDKDRNLFLRIKGLINSGIGKYEHIKDVILMLREYVKVGEVEKKKFGEVMTPLELVKEMLATLPEEVWSNPNLKWLDPANGSGPYPLMVIYRLMNGLKDWEPDEEKRYKHIVEKMIYVCELQPKNMFLYMCAVDPWDMYQLNIYTGSFLEEGFDKHMKEVWGFYKMDVIIGNYPYQEQKTGFKKSQPLWNLFVKKSITILEEAGYMTTVHPGGWRNVDGVFKEIQICLKNREMLYLKIHNFKRGQDIFNAAITFDYYTIRNSKNENFLTKIIFEDGEEFNIDISKYEFLPNESFGEISKLIAKEGESKVTILHSFSFYETRKPWMKRDEDLEYKYPCVYTIKSPDKNNEPTFYYSSKKSQFFDIPKVIWGNGATGVFIDKNGEYGLTQFAYAIIDEETNLENIKKALQTEKFVRDIMGFKHSLGDKYNRKIISTFRKDFWKEFMNEKECVYSKNKI